MISPPFVRLTLSLTIFPAESLYIPKLAPLPLDSPVSAPKPGSQVFPKYDSTPFLAYAVSVENLADPTALFRSRDQF